MTTVETELTKADEKTAILYRKAMPGHLCPFGLKARDLLIRKGYDVEDRLITTSEENDKVKSDLNVDTTPQTFINGERIMGIPGPRRRCCPRWAR